MNICLKAQVRSTLNGYALFPGSTSLQYGKESIRLGLFLDAIKIYSTIHIPNNHTCNCNTLLQSQFPKEEKLDST